MAEQAEHLMEAGLLRELPQLDLTTDAGVLARGDVMLSFQVFHFEPEQGETQGRCYIVGGADLIEGGRLHDRKGFRKRRLLTYGKWDCDWRRAAEELATSFIEAYKEANGGVRSTKGRTQVRESKPPPNKRLHRSPRTRGCAILLVGSRRPGDADVRRRHAGPMSNKSDVDFRVLGPADAEAFQRIRLERLLESPAAFGTTYGEEVAKPLDDLAEPLRLTDSDGGFVLGAFHNGELIGMVGLRRHRRVKYWHKAEVWGMYVAAGWRRQGVGRALLDETLSRARRMAGLKQITLTVMGRNAAARSLYEARGFVTFGVEEEGVYSEGAYLPVAYMQVKIA
jgi:ribosomal protein S18 acetylase RimI-like enzyme